MGRWEETRFVLAMLHYMHRYMENHVEKLTVHGAWGYLCPVAASSASSGRVEWSCSALWTHYLPRRQKAPYGHYHTV